MPLSQWDGGSPLIQSVRVVPHKQGGSTSSSFSAARTRKLLLPRLGARGVVLVGIVSGRLLCGEGAFPVEASIGCADELMGDPVARCAAIAWLCSAKA